MTTTHTFRAFAIALTLGAAPSLVVAPAGAALPLSGNQDGTLTLMQGATPGQAPAAEFARRGRGADDGPNHDVNDDKGGRGRGRGADDGPNHAEAPLAPEMEIARRGRGADDGPNHDVNDDKGGRGRGRGTDDGPNHS